MRANIIMGPGSIVIKLVKSFKLCNSGSDGVRVSGELVKEFEMGRRPSGRRRLIVKEPKVKRSLNRRIIDTSFGDKMVIGISVNIGDAKVEAVKGADLDSIETIISFDEVIVKGLEFPIIGILP